MLEESARSESSIRFAANKGAPSYYAALQLEQSLQGADFTIVSSGGGADRYTKIIGGHLDAGIFSLSEYLDFLAPEGTPANRDIRAIAVLSPQRHESIRMFPRRWAEFQWFFACKLLVGTQGNTLQDH